VGLRSRRLSFVSNQVTFSYLSDNILHSGFTNVLCQNYGLSSSSGRCGIKQNKDKPLGGAQLDTSIVSDDINLISVDEYFSSNPVLGRCLLMKIDVEGHEVPVLKGAEEFIGEHHPMIYVELKEVAEFNIFTSLLRRHGYRIAYAERGALPNFMYVHELDFDLLIDRDSILNEVESFSLRVVEAWQLHRRIRRLTA
jgi:FkbM family methyltransferase